eukprot:425146_1
MKKKWFIVNQMDQIQLMELTNIRLGDHGLSHGFIYYDQKYGAKVADKRTVSVKGVSLKVVGAIGYGLLLLRNCGVVIKKKSGDKKYCGVGIERKHKMRYVNT